MRFERSGITIEVPGGWQASLYRRADPAGAGATTHPVLHAASFALPADRGDYGSGAVDVMAADDVFVSLVEFHADAAATALFAVAGPPRALSSDDFGAAALQRVMNGQSGCQRFFSVNGRAFCLYIVLGSHARRHRLLGQVNALLESVQVAGDSS